jgi:hypothetical protein
MKPDEELVYDFCTTLHRQHFVDEALFKRAVAMLGEQKVVDLIGVSGYYTLVSMMLNVAEMPLPPGENLPGNTGRQDRLKMPKSRKPKMLVRTKCLKLRK